MEECRVGNRGQGLIQLPVHTPPSLGLWAFKGCPPPHTHLAVCLAHRAFKGARPPSSPDLRPACRPATRAHPHLQVLALDLGLCVLQLHLYVHVKGQRLRGLREGSEQHQAGPRPAHMRPVVGGLCPALQDPQSPTWAMGPPSPSRPAARSEQPQGGPDGWAAAQLVPRTAGASYTGQPNAAHRAERSEQQQGGVLMAGRPRARWSPRWACTYGHALLPGVTTGSSTPHLAAHGQQLLGGGAVLEVEVAEGGVEGGHCLDGQQVLVVVRAALRGGGEAVQGLQSEGWPGLRLQYEPICIEHASWIGLGTHTCPQTYTHRLYISSGPRTPTLTQALGHPGCISTPSPSLWLTVQLTMVA